MSFRQQTHRCDMARAAACTPDSQCCSAWLVAPGLADHLLGELADETFAQVADARHLARVGGEEGGQSSARQEEAGEANGGSLSERTNRLEAVDRTACERREECESVHSALAGPGAQLITQRSARPTPPRLPSPSATHSPTRATPTRARRVNS